MCNQIRSAVVPAYKMNILVTHDLSSHLGTYVKTEGQAVSGLDRCPTWDGPRTKARLGHLLECVNRGISILTCSNCQRILYWTGEPVQIVPQPERKTEAVGVEEAAETTE